MQLVRATLSDLDDLIVFFREAWEQSGPEHLGFTGATEETINEIASDEFLKKRLLNPDVNIYIIKGEDKVLGFASTRNIDREAIELSGVIMLDSATGKGFGTQLVEKAVSSAREAGFRRMVVKTEVVNERAVKFYRRMGFSEVSKTREKVERTAVEVMILERGL